jgi:erythromycin esterase
MITIGFGILTVVLLLTFWFLRKVKKDYTKPKNILSFLLIFYWASQSIIAQTTVKDYVKKSAVEIKHLSIKDNGVTDLEAVGRAIGDSRIVALGEQNHGDGTTFEAKGRLVRYLHEQKGFNVLVFESDYFGLTYGFENIPKTQDSINHFIFNNVMGNWAWCDKAKSFLYEYISQTHTTQSPLQIAGMDSQFHGSYTVKNLVNRASQIFSKIINTKQDSIQAKVVLENLPQTYYWTYKEPDSTALENGWASISKLLKEKKLDSLSIEERLMIDNIKLSYEQMIDVLHKTYYTDYNYTKRDRQMFNNLMWLLKYKFPNEKIIIWAHNAHIAKFNQDFEDNNQKGVMTGHFLGNKKTNPFSYYAIGVTSYNANPIWVGMNYTIAVEKPKKNSFENWINPNWNFSFIDWKGWNETKTNEAFSMKGSLEAIQHRNFINQWNKVFDGVFFIRNVDGCKQINLEEIRK